MRELTSHVVNGTNNPLKIEVVDDADFLGNECIDYRFCLRNQQGEGYDLGQLKLHFGQSGGAGINGVTNEGLLAVVEDRLLCLQAGTFATHERGIALMKVQEALMWLHKWTRDQMERDAKGANKK